MDIIQKTIKILPHAPGVYQFSDNDGSVIYVGKAKNLFKRVSSYFSLSPLLSEKTKQLVLHVCNIRTIKVATEFEALLLEAKLIRLYAPKYNSIAKDDKSPIYIYIQESDRLPRIELSRKPKNHDSTNQNYFGPFATKRTATYVLRTLRHSIPFCQQKVRNGKPCFYTHIGLCRPCPSAIQAMKDNPEKRDLIRIYRHNIQRLIWVLSGQSKKTILSLQKEMLQQAKASNFEKAGVLRDQIQALVATINSRYDPFRFEESDKLEKAPEEQTLHLFHILHPFFPTLSFPHRIECYDISTLQGTSSVGSMVAFLDGIPHTDQYRKFKIQSVHGISDVAMMEEILKRRFHHPEWTFPDLIVIDGGKPQVTQITALLNSEKIQIPIIGLSKRFEKIIIKENERFSEITIPLSSPALQLLQHIRDEAHRFAISYHKKLRSHIW